PTTFPHFTIRQFLMRFNKNLPVFSDNSNRNNLNGPNRRVRIGERGFSLRKFKPEIVNVLWFVVVEDDDNDDVEVWDMAGILRKRRGLRGKEKKGQFDVVVVVVVWNLVEEV
ncbi:hypothetical protein A2U01_0046246, partial [Trifolium medium]|nr:hypothetical protein [Trifolium medium]